MSPKFEVIVGTYEQFLLGYQVEDIINKYKIKHSFATHSHAASIRSVDCNKFYLASGAADDTVSLYDMRYRSENGKLVHHNGTVNCISFTPDASHIITGSSDGTIAIVRCGNWQIEKHWLSPHKGFSVDTLAIHPTGKLALTTGGDGVLRTWNLIKGRQAYATNLIPRWKADAKNMSVLKWNPTGERYLLAANNKIDVYSVETAGIIEHIVFESKVVCVEFLSDNLFAIGLSDGKIHFYDLEEGTQTLKILAHDARVKCMAHQDNLLVTASSAGEVKLWSFTKDTITMLNKTNCSARISCLTLSMPCTNIKKEADEEKQEKDDKKEEVEEIKRPEKWAVCMQRIIIEEEGEEKNPKKKKSKEKRSQSEKVSIVDETFVKKKQKLLLNESPKKRKGSEIDILASSSKKKKNVNNKKSVGKKRKSEENVEILSNKIKTDNSGIQTQEKKRKFFTERKIEADKKTMRKNAVNLENKKKKKHKTQR